LIEVDGVFGRVANSMSSDFVGATNIIGGSEVTFAP
jgi:hypothetical protein